MNERTGNWIRAHVHMFEFFGGVTPMLVAELSHPKKARRLQCQTVPEKGMQQAQSVSWGRTAITGTFACYTLRTGRVEESHSPVQLSHRSRRYVLLRASSVYQR